MDVIPSTTDHILNVYSPDLQTDEQMPLLILCKQTEYLSRAAFRRLDAASQLNQGWHSLCHIGQHKVWGNPTLGDKMIVIGPRPTAPFATLASSAGAMCLSLPLIGCPELCSTQERTGRIFSWLRWGHSMPGSAQACSPTTGLPLQCMGRLARARDLCSSLWAPGPAAAPPHPAGPECNTCVQHTPHPCRLRHWITWKPQARWRCVLRHCLCACCAGCGWSASHIAPSSSQPDGSRCTARGGMACWRSACPWPALAEALVVKHAAVALAVTRRHAHPGVAHAV